MLSNHQIPVFVLLYHNYRDFLRFICDLIVWLIHGKYFSVLRCLKGTYVSIMRNKVVLNSCQLLSTVFPYGLFAKKYVVKVLNFSLIPLTSALWY